MKEYYTYAYLREDGTPYYIGKGKGNRINDYHTKFVKVPAEKKRLIKNWNKSMEWYREELSLRNKQLK